MVFIEVLAKKKNLEIWAASSRWRNRNFFFNACVNTEGPALRYFLSPWQDSVLRLSPSVPASFLSTPCKRPLFQIQSLFPHLNRGLSFLRDTGVGEEALCSPYHSQAWTEAEASEDTKQDNFPTAEQIATACSPGGAAQGAGWCSRPEGCLLFLTTAPDPPHSASLSPPTLLFPSLAHLPTWVWLWW